VLEKTFNYRRCDKILSVSETPFPPTQVPYDAAYYEAKYRLTVNYAMKLEAALAAANEKIYRLEGPKDFQESIGDFEKEYLDSLKKLENDRREVAEAQQEEKEVAKTRRKYPGHGPTEQPNLPIKETTVELPAEATTCPVCQGQLKPMGEQFEESEEIDIEVKAYVRRKIKRRKYRCSCNSCVVTAPSSPRIIPGGRYSDEFGLQVVAEKYLEHCPLERQARQMRRLGLDVLTQTLYDQTDGFAKFIHPLYIEFGRQQILQPLLHADETRWPRLDKKELANWVVWTLTSPRIAFISILESKKTNAAKALFEGFKGTIIADGYQVYKKLASEDPNLRLANCWAHVLRKFIEIRGNFPTACDKVTGLIGKLYDVEREVEGPFPGDKDAQDRRRSLRQKESVPILKKIKTWAEVETGLPNSELGKAVRYMLKRWSALTLFLKDPIIPLDNNAAERSLRGPVIGRKVHYGSKSKRGTEVAAIFYTIFETAKLNCRDPVAYLREAVRQLHQGGAPLMPWDYQAELDAAAIKTS
jgi:transposase